MDPVNTDHSRAHSISLLENLWKWVGDEEEVDNFQDIGAWWWAVSGDEDKSICGALLNAIAICLGNGEHRAVKGVETSLLDQLTEILAYGNETLRREHLNMIFLFKAIQHVERPRRRRRGKNNRSERELPIVVDAICRTTVKSIFEPNAEYHHDFWRNAFHEAFQDATCKANAEYDRQNIFSGHLSAFQYAATLESDQILKVILNALLASSENIVTHLEMEASDRQVEEADVKSEAAIRMATEKNTVVVGQLLHEALASLPQHIRYKASNIIKETVQNNESLLNEAVWEIAVTASLPEVAHYLFKVKDGMFLTEAHIAFVIEKGSAFIWNMFPEHLRYAAVSALDVNILRKIILAGKADMVEVIFRQRPTHVWDLLGEDYEILLRELKKRCANENNHGAYETIRYSLVGSMVRNRNLGIQDIRDILKSSEIEVYEMSLHFPNFKSDTKHGNFANYVQSLKTMKSKFFRFEKVLKYASFPELSDQTPCKGSQDMRQDHREVMDIFDWLEDRGVQQVLSLSVDDRLYCPHTDEDVAACANTFGVRVLKWRKLDIYLKHLIDDSIEELHLYSSGNLSVHDQWLSQLPRFKQLKKLCVYVVKDVIRPRLIQKITEDLERDIDELNKKQGYPWASDEEDTTHPKVKVSQIFWIGQPDTAAVDQSLDNRTSDILSSRLASFVEKFCSYHRDYAGTRKTKVALIDSGVVVVGGRRGEHFNDDVFSTLAHRIVEGISLVSRDDEEHTWWHATEPHGTQMAALICTLNPFCDLYVVKVAESNASGITGHNVARAIEWARSKGVDVISLSLVTFSDPDRKMFEAIKAAKEDDIVVICSTADEGSIGAHSVGENNENALSIAACDRWGNLLPQSQKTGFDYQFLGHNVHVGQVPYLESLEVIEGSSVSTAIAAGVASLILACARLSSTFLDNDLHEKDGRRQSWRCDTVKKRFDSMSEGKWVVLDNLCGQGELKKWYDFKRLVDDSFKS